jgi:Cof subfamily protein (haloacid dehalogenase superfamily)
MSSKPITSTAGTSTATVRAIFLDVDGTYADFGVVPEGHVRAVRAARSAGHKVLLCTGRPVSMLPQSILAAGFDGLVASAGAYAEVDGEVLLDRRFPADLAARTVAVLDGHNAVYILEAQDSLHVAPEAELRLRAIIEEHFQRAPDGHARGSSAILGSMRATSNRAATAFAKISVFEAPVPMERIAREIGVEIAVVANSIANGGRHAGELYQRGISKADGVAAVIARLGIEQEDTVAVGDGQNDLEMIAFAGVGIAIEGSSPELLALADRTAAPPHREGLVDAFVELGLF